MSVFYYTNSAESLNSSALDSVYYNNVHQTLVVLTQDGYAYLYSGVPYSVFSYLAYEASSVGNYYATHIKSTYGPAQYLGYKGATRSDVKFEHDPYGRQTASLAEPKDAVVVNSTNINITQPNPVSLSSKYTVAFEYGGQVREHNLETNSIENAILAVQAIAEMLDLDFKIKSVTWHFE